MTVTNEQIIQAVFPATDEAKKRALQILRGEELSGDSNEPLFLTMGEACELIPCSRATLWRIIKAGRLPKIEIYPNAFRLRRTDVLDLARGKAVSRG